MTEAHISIHGRVQGVFFRAFIKAQAEKFHVTGWTQNEPDGTVSVLAQGDRDRLENFIELCKMGPTTAKIEDIKIEWIQHPSQKFHDFTVR